MRVEHLPEKLKPAQVGSARIHVFRLVHSIAGGKDLAVDFEVAADVSDEALRRMLGHLTDQLISAETWLLQSGDPQFRANQRP
jgi:hypothetical protein